MKASLIARLDEFLAMDLSSMKLIMIGLPILLGVGIGFLISYGQWMYALILALLIPIAILFTKRPFIGVIFWMLIMPYISVLPNSSLMYILFHRILLVLTLGFMLIKLLQMKRSSTVVQIHSIDLAVILLMGLSSILIITLQANYISFLSHYVDRFLLPLLLFMIVRLNPLDKQDLNLMQWSVLCIAISQSFIGIIGVIAPGILPAALRPLLQGYATGTLDNPSVFGIVMVFCGLLLYQSAMSRRKDWVRALFMLACGFCVLGVFLCMERSAWLASVLVLLGLLFIYPKPMLKVLMVGGVTLLILFLTGLLSAYIGSSGNRIYSEQPVYDRVVVTDAMLRMVQEKPLVGWGYETLNENVAKYYRTIGNARITLGFVTSHNTYLTIMTELGLVTFLLYLYPFIFLAITTIKNRLQLLRVSSGERSMLSILWLVALSYFLITNFLDMRWYPYEVGLWWMILGMIANIIVPLVTSSKSTARKRYQSMISENNRLNSDHDRGY